MNRKKLILAILLLLLPLTLFFSYIRQPKEQHAGNLKSRVGSVAGTVQTGLKTKTVVQPDDKTLHLDLLDKELPRFTGYRKNIFQPIFREELKPLPFRPAPPVTKLPLPPPPPPPPLPPALPPVIGPTPIQQDIAKITFLGFLKKENQKTVFLSKDKEIFIVKKGDTIAGKYDVTNVTDDALTINPKSGGGEIVIPLIENKPLNVQHQGK